MRIPKEPIRLFFDKEKSQIISCKRIDKHIRTGYIKLVI